MGVVLTEADRAFLAARARGVPGTVFAREHGYSRHWPKWKSRQIRRRFGVATLEEAFRLSEITREEFDSIRRGQEELRDAIRRLDTARTPEAQRDARADVRDARADLDTELRRRGLSEADLDKLQDEKEYEKFKARQARLDQEREEEAAKKAEADAKAEEERLAKEAEEKKRDGLGGRRNR